MDIESFLKQLGGVALEAGFELAIGAVTQQEATTLPGWERRRFASRDIRDRAAEMGLTLARREANFLLELALMKIRKDRKVEQ